MLICWSLEPDLGPEGSGVCLVCSATAFLDFYLIFLQKRMQQPVLSHCLVASQVTCAGRFWTKALAITLVSDENNAKILNDVQGGVKVDIVELPEETRLRQ